MAFATQPPGKTRLLALCTLLLAGLVSFGEANTGTAQLEVLKVEGTIVPAVANYIDRGIRQAEAKGSTACIIELNTPGGLLDSTEKIVTRILNAKVPIVVYVSPSGSWAASAGTFITIAAHIAAMTPGTSIGAAHPVAIGQEMPEEMKKKATEFSSAWIRSVAQLRGRNPEEAELAVTESKSFTPSEALEAGLIDLVADDLQSLIKQINGKRVTLANGEQKIIETTSYTINRNQMNFAERFLHIISDPNIAYILLSLATIGLITEISNPGMIFPGVFGGISLFLAFYSLGVLNANWAGVLLIMLAFGLFIAELFTPAFGILTAGGLVSLVIGSLILFSGASPQMEVNRGLIAAVTVLVGAFVVFVIGAVVRGQRRRVVTGPQALIGKTATVKTELAPKGTVLVDGELWTAIIDEDTAKPGEEVIIVGVEGLKLTVTKKTKRRKR